MERRAQPHACTRTQAREPTCTLTGTRAEVRPRLAHMPADAHTCEHTCEQARTELTSKENVREDMRGGCYSRTKMGGRVKGLKVRLETRKQRI